MEEVSITSITKWQDPSLERQAGAATTVWGQEAEVFMVQKWEQGWAENLTNQPVHGNNLARSKSLQFEVIWKVFAGSWRT